MSLANWWKNFFSALKPAGPAGFFGRAEPDKYKNIVVGKILEIKPHPNADRLSLVSVDVGTLINSGQFLEIVCGAKNIRVGQFVPVALVGATLPGGMEIKQVAIRGVKSSGMLCAADELGLGQDHQGIMILGKSSLPPDATVGTSPNVREGRPGQTFGEYLKSK